MEEILLAAAPFLKSFLKWFFMKKDSELPWVARLFRWGCLAFCACYGLLLIVEKWQEVFP